MKITMLGRRRSGKTWLYRRLIDGLNPSELLGEGESQEEVSGAPSQKAPYVPDFKGIKSFQIFLFNFMLLICCVQCA